MHNRYTTTKNSFANILAAGETLFDLTNFSMLGCTISKGKSLIARHKKAVEECDIMVLEYGGNDSDHNWAEIAESPKADHLPKTPIEEFSRSYKEIINELTSLDKKIVMLNLPPIDEHKYLNWFSRGLNKGNILEWLGGSDEYIYRFHEIYNAQVCNIAAENNIPLVDIRSAFLKMRNYSDYLCDDGIHPNEKGHDLIAKVISAEIPQLEELLVEKTIARVSA